MVTERGRKQVRSRERREQLLNAAVELIAEGGTRAVTHRAVSARAGLPPAAAGYYFTTSDELVVEALRFHTVRRTELVGQMLRAAVTGATSALEIGTRVTTAFTQHESAMALPQFEVYLEANRNPAVRDTVAEAMEKLEEVVVPLLRSLGLREPEQAAKAFVAAFDGFALRRLANPLPKDVDSELLFHTVVGLLLTYSMDREMVDEQVRHRYVQPAYL